MTKELKQQFTLKISQANKTGLVVILYEMLLIYLEEATQAYEKDDKEGFRLGIKRAKACLHELISSLNHQYALSGNLLQLYTFADRQMIKADARYCVKELDVVKSMMEKLHAAYAEISEQDDSEPVMANTQAVYAGLTYGRGQLTENLADQGSSRGFFA